MSTYSAPAFGIQPTGFVQKLVSDIILDITAQLQGPNGVDPNLDLSPSEPMGQVLQIVASEIAEVWEITSTLYNSLDPNDAEDFLLDAVSAISGTKREGATYSYCICTLNLNASTTINVGTIANVSGQPANQWQLIGQTSDVGGDNLVVGPVVSSGSGNYYGYFRATQTGPQVAVSGTLTVVASPPSGLNSITNAADAIQGSLAQTDAQLRTSRQEELAASGSGTLDSIRADISDVPGVKTCFVYENTGSTTDGSGRPPHSVECVIFDGVTANHSLDNLIAQALWNDKPAGTPYFSATGDSGIATDSQGVTHTVPFSRAVVQNIWIVATTTPTGNEATIKANWAAWAGDNVGLGSELYALQFKSAIIPQAGASSPYYVTDLLDVPTFAFDTRSSPSNTGNLAGATRTYYYVTGADMTVNGI